jgi:hypothetical protein
MLPAKLRSIWPSCLRGEDFFNINQSEKKKILAAMFVGRMEPNGPLYKVSPFRSVPPTNMVTKGNSCF